MNAKFKEPLPPKKKRKYDSLAEELEKIEKAKKNG